MSNIITNKTKRAAPFRSGRELLRTYAAYVAGCAENKHLPNFAGFAAWWEMGRAELAALRLGYPREYDVICASLIDEALNSKILNSGAVLQYIEGLPGALSEEGMAHDANAPLRIICAQNPCEDGA